MNILISRFMMDVKKKDGGEVRAHSYSLLAFILRRNKNENVINRLLTVPGTVSSNTDLYNSYYQLKLD